jgi:hypothetical protein
MASTKQGFVHASDGAALPAPYQLAIEDVPFRMAVLEDQAPRDHGDSAVAPPMWFSVALGRPTRKRYLYLVQKETETGLVVVLLLFDRVAAEAEGELRLPARGAWLRAVVDGTVYVLASDLALSRKAITAWIGGGEPPTSPAQPPYT